MKHTKDISKTAAAGSAAHIMSANDRAAAGKALRDKLPRERHGIWKEFKSRPDPIGLLHKSDAGRMKNLVPIRYGRMLQSPFAFYRGSAAIMASDLSRTPNTGLKVQACGDCHLMNFGGFATPERNIIFDINDFDETSPAPWEWDVKRLVASFVLAARSNGLSDRNGRDCAETAARSYREHMREFSRMDPLRVWYSTIDAEDIMGLLPKAYRKQVSKRIEKASAGSGSELDFPKLAGTVGGQTRITDQPPLIFHPEETNAPEARATIEKLLRDYRETMPEDRRMLFDRYRFVDIAIKVVGVGSVGRNCWIVLMMSEENSPLFLQVKEAVRSVLEPYAGNSAYSHHGQRVVLGQRLMQPASDIFLGWLTGIGGRHLYVRQLRDAKIKPLVETFNAEALNFYAVMCGWVLARAHSKVSEISATISGYLGSSNDEFDEAMGKFALAYADQAEHDYAALKAAVRKGKVTVYQEP
ncbi:DUF2252 domain-containing protein [Rhodoplanes sp. Z2-YC6860]|uniref:DUF2252 domain-containing protein n=1 Tax=Rhodoplanes sp. Z2-YC6860 TaxID=674703 RepID=UPI00078C6E8F|nr:DUF2252 domain-containing protein [Rhodoplanes sp. Z2-YC6860]AMN44780.1 hypothetical protein RHPLAN_63740 [Rhodoplanes sp. Z2-YC6860]